MKLTRARHCSVFHSWDKDQRTTLQVIPQDGIVMLQHIDTRYMENDLTILQLDAAEALSVAERLKKVLRGERAGNPGDDHQEPHLKVVFTTDGEPYREGVRLSLCAGNWERDFDFTMTQETAGDLAKALTSASTLLAAG